jgi:hypothetical protein
MRGLLGREGGETEGVQAVKLFGYEIRRASPKWARQRDLFFKCPKCGDFVKLRRLENGDTLLTVLYGINKIERIELSCKCGGMILLCSEEYAVEAKGPVDWKRLIQRALEGAKS